MYIGANFPRVAAVLSRVDMPTGRLKGPAGELDTRPLLAVVVSTAWMQIYDTSLVVRYKTMLPVLNSIKSGAAHALALHMLTHKNGTATSLDGVLTTIGAFQPGMRETSKHRLRREVRKWEAELGALGISFYNGGTMLSYRQPQGVSVNNPDNSQK